MIVGGGGELRLQYYALSRPNLAFDGITTRSWEYMSAMKRQERRKADRFGAALVAWVNMPPTREKERSNRFLLTRDVSSTGMFLYGRDVAPLGASLTMEIGLPFHGMRLLRAGKSYYGAVKACVSRTVDDGFAVKFDDDYQLERVGERVV